MKLSKKAQNAILIGTLCAISYLAVYVARNILSAVSPQLTENGVFDDAFLGKLSSAYFIFYAAGQLINGAIGQKINARWMISLGLLFAGVANFVFPYITATKTAALSVYGMSGFFLAMIYGPMTKVVAENTEPIHATRVSLGYTFASFFGSPLAGVIAALLAWGSVFIVSSVALIVMAIICFSSFIILERKGIVKYNQYKVSKAKGGSIKVLIEHRIIKFALIAFLTGIIRTAVVFWLPIYIKDYLGYSSEISATIFSVATFVMSFTTFIVIFIYERLKYRMDLTLLLMFISSTVFFILVYVFSQPVLNIAFMVLAVMASNGAATMLWSVYCPSLRDTGMVSGATGFLDCLSYIGAAISSAIFGNAVSAIGWGNLILVWAALMLCGIVVALPYRKWKEKRHVLSNDAVTPQRTENQEENSEDNN